MNFFDFGEEIKENTEFVIFGIPWDYLTSIKAPNSAIAPQKIRDVTQDIALTSEMGYEIPKIKAIDIGNITIEPENIVKNIREIENFINKIINKKRNAILVMIGGDHFCSYPVIKTLSKNAEIYNGFGVLIFDSHLDLYEKWDKGIFSHATVSHRIFDLDLIDNEKILIVGTRDIDIPELKIAKKEKIQYLNAFELAEIGLDSYIKIIVDFFSKSEVKNLYVSIDIDALDPSIAPATGFPIPGGFTYREMWRILREIAKKFKIIGFDLVEVAPNLDNNNITSNLAAKLIIEFMSFIVQNR